MCQIATESDSIFLTSSTQNEMECGDKKTEKRNNKVDEIWDFQAVVG